MTALLSVRDLHVRLGGSHVLQGVSFEVPEGAVTALLGRNGVGKTTTLRALLGLVPAEGQATLGGADVIGEPTHRVFSTLTVAENLELAVRNGSARYDFVYDLFPELRTRAAQAAGTLSGGQQQMLAISRALMAAPDLILLDEPSLGLSPKLTREIFEIVVRINRERGTTLLLVEQNANMALNVADYGYVLENGRIVMEDTCAKLREKEDIKEFYLGMKEEGVRGERRWKKKKNWR